MAAIAWAGSGNYFGCRMLARLPLVLVGWYEEKQDLKVVLFKGYKEKADVPFCVFRVALMVCALLVPCFCLGACSTHP